MRRTTVLTYEMLARVKDYGASRVTDFPASSRGGLLFAEVSAIVAQLSHQATVQTASIGNALVSSALKAKLRASLRADLRILCRTARLITADNPELKKKFRLPKSGDQQLLSAARAFLENAEPFLAEFPRNDIPAEVLVKLGGDIDAFEAAMGERNQNTSSRVQATARLEELLSRGVKAEQKLDVLVRNRYRNDKASLVSWDAARHVEQHSSGVKDQSKSDQEKEVSTNTTSGAAAGSR